MRKRIGAIVLTGGAAALLMATTGPPSLATTARTWSVSPGGSFTAAQSGHFTLTDTTTGNSLTCSTTKGQGSFKSGSGLPGAGIGRITSLSFTGCTGPKGLTFTMKTSHFPWILNAVSYDPAITLGLTTGTITGIHATLSGTGCSATVDGTSATADNGMTQIHFHNSLDKFKLRHTAANLHVYNVSGCLKLIKSGDAITFSSAYLLTPKQTITSP